MKAMPGRARPEGCHAMGENDVHAGLQPSFLVNTDGIVMMPSSAPPNRGSQTDFVLVTHRIVAISVVEIDRDYDDVDVL